MHFRAELRGCILAIVVITCICILTQVWDMDEAYQKRLASLNNRDFPVHGPYQHEGPDVRDPDLTIENMLVEGKEDEVLNRLYHGDLSDFVEEKEYTPTNEEKERIVIFG